MALNHPVQRNVQICGARIQESLKGVDLDAFVKRTDMQLRNLPVTYRGIVDDMDIYNIREMFHDSDIPFRYGGCARNNLTCCCTCMHKCPQRCPQDVMYRAYLICGQLLEATPDVFEARWNMSSVSARMMYKELTREFPRYEVVRSLVEENMSVRTNQKLRTLMFEGNAPDNPNKLVYAPAFAYEQRRVKLPNGELDVRYIPKANPETGDLLILNWPRSGVCPFCIPCGIINRNRIMGPNRKSNGKKKGAEREHRFNARDFEN